MAGGGVHLENGRIRRPQAAEAHVVGAGSPLEGHDAREIPRFQALHLLPRLRSTRDQPVDVREGRRALEYAVVVCRVAQIGASPLALAGDETVCLQPALLDVATEAHCWATSRQGGKCARTR
jgi:hypothetical protein